MKAIGNKGTQRKAIKERPRNIMGKSNETNDINGDTWKTQKNSRSKERKENQRIFKGREIAAMLTQGKLSQPEPQR